MSDFSTRQVSVTLSGAQWFALLARIAKSTPHTGLFSKKGALVYRQATEALQKQLVEENAK